MGRKNDFASRTKRGVPRERTTLFSGSTSAEPLRVVAIGASAGGVEACTRLFQTLPPDTGLAFVLVQHRQPGHESLLANLLSKSTEMPVREVTRATRVEPNHVYINPPDADMDCTRRPVYLSSAKADSAAPSN
jgi:two-component system, chemotaxis family, CheB/CheR fusion protein